jgi:uncharacterized membrane protein YgcG
MLFVRGSWCVMRGLGPGGSRSAFLPVCFGIIAFLRALRVFVVCLLLSVFVPCAPWLRFQSSREDAKWLFSHGGTEGTGGSVRGSGAGGRFGVRGLGTAFFVPISLSFVRGALS